MSEMQTVPGILAVINSITANRESGRLEIDASGTPGTFLFNQGKLVHASLGSLKGFPAVNAAVAVRDVQFIFDHVAPDSPLALEEIFGPVLPVIRVRDADEAFRRANATRYGLAASLFTRNQHVVREFLRRVECGMAHINHGTASQAHVPFGGVKDSGQGAFSIGPTVKDAFTNIKTVYVKA